MKLSEVIRAVRFRVNDSSDASNPEGRHYSDLQITDIVNEVVGSLYVRKLEADESWFNHKLSLSKDDAVKDEDRIWTYEVPSWVDRVSFVREDKPSGDPRGRALFPVNKRTLTRGWYWDGAQTIRAQGYPEAIDIRVGAAKLPAPAHKGSVLKDAEASKFYLDNTSSLQTLKETDAYAGSVIEITGTDASGHLVEGQTRQVVSSSTLWDVSAWIELVTFAPWTVIPTVSATDTYELQIPLKRTHLNYVAALCAEVLFIRTNNTNGLASIQRVLAKLEEEFISAIQPRQEQMPNNWQFPDELEAGRHDPDRDPWSIYYGAIF